MPKPLEFLRALGTAISRFARRLRRFNAEAQRFAEGRREFFFSAFLRVPLRLCVKTVLALVAALQRDELATSPDLAENLRNGSVIPLRCIITNHGGPSLNSLRVVSG